MSSISSMGRKLEQGQKETNDRLDCKVDRLLYAVLALAGGGGGGGIVLLIVELVRG